MTFLAPEKPPLVAFPMEQVRACLELELVEIAKAEAGVRQLSLPSAPAQILKAPIRLDSLSVVDALCAVEKVVGFELSDSLVSSGGYPTIEAALAHLIPRIEAAWTKKKGTKS
jgi:hypothetical protein